MRVRVYNESGERLPPVSVHSVSNAVSRVLRLKKNIECSIIFLSSQAMRTLNKKSRRINRVTDVLSFPFHTRRPYCADQDGTIRLGDVYISLPTARSQAITNGYSTSREIRGLIVHGILHLLGYDHTTNSEAQRMARIAEDIVQLAEHKG